MRLLSNSIKGRGVVFGVVLVCALAGLGYSGTTTVSYQVLASADDGFAWSSTEQDVNSLYLMIGNDRDYSAPYYMSAMRFANVAIPRSAAIVDARLKIKSLSDGVRGQIYGVIQAESADDAADFGSRYIADTNKTAASVDWDHKFAWDTNTWYTGGGISNVVQEVVNRTGWSSGNSIAIFYSTRQDSGKSRMFGSFDLAPDSAAVLEITYETYSISGYVLDTNMVPLEGVNLSAGSGIEGTVTDSNGYYILLVPPSWSGDVTAKKIKWDITPQSYSYSQLTADIDGQDYIADYIGIIIVKADGTGDCPTIQAAIDAAVDGDVVILQPGTYTGDSNRDIDFKGKGITVQGATGDPNDCIIDCQGTRQEPHRGFKFISGEDANSILEGITITNGYGPGEDIYGTGSLYYNGGAVFCHSSSPIINNCVFSNNSTTHYGGGIYNHNNNSTISNCIIIENSGLTSGGGICNYDSNSSIENCILSDNTVRDYSGGGITNYYGNPVINNCVINNNLAHYNGGGIFNSSSNVTINNCSINNNSTIYDASGFSGGRGGGIYNENSTLIINYCTINNNVASGCNYMNYGGGGIYKNGGNSIIKNSVISNNLVSSSSCAVGGGGIYNYGYGDMLISNCTIRGNLMSSIVSTYGGGVFSANQNLHITNSIIWANQSSQISGNPSVTVIYSNIQGGYAGVGNINADPLFVADGYNLSGVSPCIDAGDPNYIAESNETDIDGHPRVIIRIDMGADEFAYIGDFDGDGQENFADYAVFASAWMSEVGDLNWDPNCDISEPNDNVIDERDLAVFCENWLAGL